MSNRDDSTPAGAAAAAPIPTLLAQTGLFASLAGAGLALSLWFFLRRDTGIFAQHNVLHDRSVWHVLLTMVGAGATLSLGAAAHCLARGTREAVAQVHRLASLLLPLALSFALPLFFRLELWQARPLFLASTALIWGLLLERSLRVALAAAPPLLTLGELRLIYPWFFRWAPWAVVMLMTIGFFGYMAYYTVLRHLQMETRAYDLGVYNNTFWNLLRGEFFYSSPCLGMRGSQIQYHATLTAYLLLPFYALYQRAESLLVIQAALCALGALPLYGLARRRLASDWMAVALVAAYFLYAPAHGAIFYDFHFLTISPVFVLTVLYCFETRRRAWLWISLAIALLNREDLGIGLACAFLFYLLNGERPGAAVIGGIVSITYVALSKFVLLPAFSHSLTDSFIYAYKAYATPDAPGFAGVLRTWATNPYFFASRVLIESKLTYTLIMLVPLLLLPLRDPRTWLFMVFGGIITIFSHEYAPLLQTSFQYTASWTGFVFAGAAIALSFWRGRADGAPRMGPTVLAVLLVSVVMSYNLGAFSHENGFRGGFAEVKFEMTDTDRTELQDLRALIAQIPPEASVTVSEYESPHVSSRRDAFTLSRGHNGSDYVLLRTTSARGGRERDTMNAVVRSGEYGILATRGAFQLWQKGASPEGNRAAARALGLPPSAVKN